MVPDPPRLENDMNMMTITKVSPDEFSKDVDRYISEANTLHKVFEIPGGDEKSVVVLSKQDFEGWPGKDPSFEQSGQRPGSS
jgi:hypothetical protein